VSPPENYVTFIVKALFPDEGLPVPTVDYFIYCWLSLGSTIFFAEKS
jgi:hypothetical protein